MDEQEKAKRQEKKYRNIIIGIIVFLDALLVIYFGMALYFINHFYFGSEINDVDVSGKSVEKVKEQMTTELQAYTLNLRERGGMGEKISAGEIGLKYTPDGAFDNFKGIQNPLKWISSLFYTGNSKIAIGVSYNEKLLKQRVDVLCCFDNTKVVEPKNPAFKYTDSGYVVVDEVNGNKVNKDTLYGHVADAIFKRQYELDLESTDCYINPQYTSKSQKVAEVRDLLDRYVSSKVIYTFGETKKILDDSTINKWITVDDNLEVTLDEKKIRDYINVLSDNYAETGNAANFVTSSGKTINIHGGDYKWVIDADKEIQDLNGAIKEGATVIKKPDYILTAYVEIDLIKQHLWFYKNGSLIVQGDIVSGNLDKSHATPEGVYKLKYKEKNAILRGPGYAAPVDFWMPFYNGMGIHDATWRRAFGGNIYKGDGSHGCINCPYNLAKTIFDNIDKGTPVICYY